MKPTQWWFESICPLPCGRIEDKTNEDVSAYSDPVIDPPDGWGVYFASPSWDYYIDA